MLLAGVLTPLLLMCGCQSSSRSSAPPPPLIGTAWVLIELNGKSFIPSEGLQLPTLKLDAAKQQASGTSGINRYAGSYDLNGSTIKFGPLMGTRMAGPPEAMAAEEAFLAAMRNVRGWSIIKQSLELTDGGKQLLRFKPDHQTAGTADP